MSLCVWYCRRPVKTFLISRPEARVSSSRNASLTFSLCTLLLIRAVSSMKVTTVVSDSCFFGTTDRFSFSELTRRSLWFNKLSVWRMSQSHQSLAYLLTDWLVGCLRDRAKLLPQQFQHIVHVLVSRSAHATQMYRLEVGMRRDVGAGAMQFIQSKPEGIWIHLD